MSVRALETTEIDQTAWDAGTAAGIGTGLAWGVTGLFDGSATVAIGTDTTHRALAKAQQLCASRLKVGLFCRSMGLAAYWREHVRDWRQAIPVHTGQFSDYAQRIGVFGPTGRTTAGHRRQPEDRRLDGDTLNRMLRLATKLPENLKLDAVIVHEAADFTELEWQVLRATLRHTDSLDGPDAGRIFAFSDGAAGSCVAVPDVPVTFHPCFTDDAEDLASDCVSALLREGWSRNQIAVLATGQRHPFHDANLLDAGSPADYWTACHEGDEEFYGLVREFSGLERPAVVLCVNGFDDSSAAAKQMRVGLTRGRSRLVVAGNPAVIEAAAGPAVAAALASSQRRPVALPVD